MAETEPCSRCDELTPDRCFTCGVRLCYAHGERCEACLSSDIQRTSDTRETQPEGRTSGITNCTREVRVEGGSPPPTEETSSTSTDHAPEDPAPTVQRLTATTPRAEASIVPVTIASTFHPTCSEGGQLTLLGDGSAVLELAGTEPWVDLTVEATCPQVGFTVLPPNASVELERTGPLTARVRIRRSGRAVILAHVGDGWSPPGGTPDPGCVSLNVLVELAPPAPVDGLPVERTLFSDTTGDNYRTFFYVSNEHDWRGFAPDPPQRSVVVSFSNNVGWDQAVESGADALVLCDWQAAPLVAQENLFRPLILLCDTPVQLLSYVLGEPLPTTVSACDLIGAKAALDEALLANDADARFELHMTILAALQTCDGVTPEHVEFLTRYYQAIHDLRSSGAADFPLPLNQAGHNRGDTGRDLAREFYVDLSTRYGREGLASCLSTPEGFAALKRLFLDRVYYCKGDILSIALWQSIGATFGPTSYTLNLSNVLSEVHQAKKRWLTGHERDIGKFLAIKAAAIVGALGAPVTGVTVALTLGTGGQHAFFMVSLQAPPPTIRQQIYDEI